MCKNGEIGNLIHSIPFFLFHFSLRMLSSLHVSHFLFYLDSFQTTRLIVFASLFLPSSLFNFRTDMPFFIST